MCESANGNTSINQQDCPQAELVEKNPLNDLLRVVNLTRRNRIHASNRLLETEHFVQHINIYYSCVAAIITILSLVYKDNSFGIASAIMTVALAISIVYLNAQKYGSRAQQLQMNYLALHQLQFDVSNAKRNNDLDKLEELQNRYVSLLQTSENHIDQDYRKTLWKSDQLRKHDENFKPKLIGIEKFEYIAKRCLGFAFKTILWLLPPVYFILVAYKIL